MNARRSYIIILVLLAAGGHALSRSRITQSQLPAGVSPGDLVLIGTIAKIYPVSAPIPSRRRWGVEARIDRIVSGTFAGPLFTFTVHSPALSDLEVGRTYTIKATWTPGGYLVDEHALRAARHARSTPQLAGNTECADGSDKGEVSIRIAESVMQRGERYSLDYDFHVTNGSYAVYNWQFIRLKPLPGQLAIYDAEKNYLGDLIAFSGGSQAGINGDDWTFLYGGARVGSSLEFRAGSVPNTKYDSSGSQLPAGQYYIQLILYKAFRSPNPFRVEGEKIDFYKTFDRQELCRSNVLRIRLVR